MNNIPSVHFERLIKLYQIKHQPFGTKSDFAAWCIIRSILTSVSDDADHRSDDVDQRSYFSYFPAIQTT